MNVKKMMKLFQYISNRMQSYTVYFIYIWKLLYMFRVLPPPIIKSANNCIYSIWYLSDRYCSLPLQRQVAVTVWQIPNAVDTVVCAPGNGWRYHPKHVEQFPDKINCVTLHLVRYILEYYIVYFMKYMPIWDAGCFVFFPTTIFRWLFVKTRLKRSRNFPENGW